MASLFIYFCSCCCWDAKAKVKDRKDNRFRGRRLKWKFTPHISIGSWQHTQCPFQERGELYPNSIAVMSCSYRSGHGLQPFPWLLAQIGSPSLLVNTAPLPVRIEVGSIALLSPHAYHWPYPLTVLQKKKKMSFCLHNCRLYSFSSYLVKSSLEHSWQLKHSLHLVRKLIMM